MGATEPERLALHAAARKTLGEQEGDTLMALTPPANTELATAQQLDYVAERLSSSMAALEARMDQRMAALEERMDQRMAALAARTGAQLARSERRVLVGTVAVVGSFQTLAVAFLTLTLG